MDGVKFKSESQERFQVSKVADTPCTERTEKTHISYFDEGNLEEGTRRRKSCLSVDSGRGRDLTLFEDDIGETKTAIAHIQKSLDDDKQKAAVTKKANLGSFFGVFLPCCQNIVGVIYFVRFPWLVGTAGILHGCLIVGICNIISITTAMAMSAIATNGRVTAGGTYFMISRSLGPAFGGSVGFLFFFGTSISVAMYYIGTMELLLINIAPEMRIFPGEPLDVNNKRVIGLALLTIMGTIVFIGVKCVNKFALLAIICLVAALFSVILGTIVAGAGVEWPNDSLRVCALGERLVPYQLSHAQKGSDGVYHCENTTELYDAYCKEPAGDCDYYLNSTLKVLNAVPGLSLRLLKDTLYPRYVDAGSIPGLTDPQVKANKFEVKDGKNRGTDLFEDFSTGFAFFIALYFPSITGVESGANYSGDLKDAQISIPRGTLSAVAVTSTFYLASVVFIGSSVEGMVLRDKFGFSLGETNILLLSLVAWPDKWFVLIGALTATLGAGMQALAGGPRLLQAIAQDDLIPWLQFFKKMDRGEPLRGMILTFLIAAIGIAIGDLENVTPVVTQFFLMCYGGINLSVTLQSLLDTPHWRPRFRYFHWSFTLLGTSICIAVMFVANWQYTLVGLVLFLIIYHYIQYKGAENEWGDGLTGLLMSTAIYVLNKLNKQFRHTKNWRPQILTLVRMTDLHETEGTTAEPEKTTEAEEVEEHAKFTEDDSRLVMLSSMLKGGKGLNMYGSVIKGKLSTDLYQLKEELSSRMTTCLDNSEVKGFVEVVINPSLSDGIGCMIQSAGLGSLRPNTIILGWPNDWAERRNQHSYRHFIDIMRNIALTKRAAIVLKAVTFPSHKSKMNGTIDVWWVINDGGMMLLLANLLRKSKVWNRCQFRIFTVAQENDNTIQIKKDLQTYLYQLRIDGTVDVLEMAADDIGAYVYERTLKMEERTRIMHNLIGRKQSGVHGKLPSKDIHSVLEKARGTSNIHMAMKDLQPYQLNTMSHDTTTRNTTRDVSEAGNTNVDSCIVPSSLRSSLKEPNANADYWRIPSSHRSSMKAPNAMQPENVDPDNIRQMKAAVRLNSVIKKKSQDADLVIINLPSVPESVQGQANYMTFLEVLTEDINRILLIRGTGSEVITAYN